MDTVPMLIVNMKTYQTGSGDDALDLAYCCEKVSKQEDVNIAVAVQNADLHRIAQKVDIPVFAQHIDPARYGAHTGQDIAETLQYNGADGVLINHSEDQVSLETIEDAVKHAKNNQLQSIVCIDAPEMAENVSGFKPDFIAYEPTELIGGDTSVSTAEPELVESAVKHASQTVLCGAGIKDRNDVATALEIGTDGVLVASGVVKANHPEDALRELVAGMT